MELYSRIKVSTRKMTEDKKLNKAEFNSMKVLPMIQDILTKSQEPVKIYFENSKEVMIYTEVICQNYYGRSGKK